MHLVTGLSLCHLVFPYEALHSYFWTSILISLNESLGSQLLFLPPGYVLWRGLRRRQHMASLRSWCLSGWGQRKILPVLLVLLKLSLSAKSQSADFPWPSLIWDRAVLWQSGKSSMSGPASVSAGGKLKSLLLDLSGRASMAGSRLNRPPYTVISVRKPWGGKGTGKGTGNSWKVPSAALCSSVGCD